jgi:soluble lytic murein transglycosylase-like protein
MTSPGNAPTIPLSATAPNRPGTWSAASRQTPPRSTPQNAFTRALAQAQAQNLAFQNAVTANATAAPDGDPAAGQPSGLPFDLQALAAEQTNMPLNLPPSLRAMTAQPNLAGLRAMSAKTGPATTQPGAATGQPGTALGLQAMAQSVAPATQVAPQTAARPATTGLQVPGGFGPMITEAAQKYGVDPALVAAVMETESRFNPNAVSGAGAKGLMQLMPATARGLGVTDPSDPQQAILGGAKLLGVLTQKYGGTLELALAAYNAGSGAVDKAGGIPPYGETRKYVPLVLAAYERFKSQTATPTTTPAPATTPRPAGPAAGR